MKRNEPKKYAVSLKPQLTTEVENLEYELTCPPYSSRFGSCDFYFQT